MTDLNKLMNIYSNDIPLFGALQELQQRRESELRPADKFLGNHPNEQYRHMNSELIEIENAEDVYHVIEEVIDLQMSCETMLAILGLSQEERMELRRKVIEKNANRGYYEPQQGSSQK